MIIQKTANLLLINIFSIIFYTFIIIRTSSDVLINYYQDVLYNLTSNFDYKYTGIPINTTDRINSMKTNSDFKKIQEYLSKFGNNLGINDLYISTINPKENKEYILIHKNTISKIGTEINSKFAIEAFNTQKIVSGNLRYNNHLYYSFYSPIINENGQSMGLIAFNIPQSTFTKMAFIKASNKILPLLILNIILTIFYIYLAALGLWNIFKPLYIIKNQALNISNKIFVINKNVNLHTYEFDVIQKLLVKSVTVIHNFILSLIIYLEYIKYSIAKIKIGSNEIINKIKSTKNFINRVSSSNDKLNDEIFNLKCKIETFSDEILTITNELTRTLSLNVNTIDSSHNDKGELAEFLMEISILIKKFQNQQNECQKLTILSNKINNILKNILSITNETKLLSLNASIVAISAGEEGKSFGVIAKEVGELSQNIIKSTEYIQGTLTKITTTIDLLNEESMKIFEAFKNHADKSEIFSSNLIEILNSIKNTTILLKDISFSSEKLNLKNEIILENITFLNSNSSSNLDSIKQIENLIVVANDDAISFKKTFDNLDTTINKIKLDLKQFKL